MPPWISGKSRALRPLLAFPARTDSAVSIHEPGAGRSSFCEQSLGLGQLSHAAGPAKEGKSAICWNSCFYQSGRAEGLAPCHVNCFEFGFWRNLWVQPRGGISITSILPQDQGSRTELQNLHSCSSLCGLIFRGKESGVAPENSARRGSFRVSAGRNHPSRRERKESQDPPLSSSLSSNSQLIPHSACPGNIQPSNRRKELHTRNIFKGFYRF